MTMARLVALLSLALVFLAGCASTTVDAYRAEKPALDLKAYFDGPVDAWGIFQDRSGLVVRRFHVRIDARWEGDVGTLDEHFTYSDGTTSRRVWTITRTGDGTYQGTAADVVGTARGEARGNALRWQYALDLEVDGKTYQVDFDDWMFLMDERVMLNRSIMSKFGIVLGEVTLSFRKRAPGG
jgi:hypothetical protein